MRHALILALVLAVATSGAVLANPSVAQAGTRATFSVGDPQAEVASWLDGQGRLHGAWVDGRYAPGTLRIVRVKADGSKDTAFGTNGIISTPITTAPAADWCTTSGRLAGGVSFASDGTVVVATYRARVVDGSCEDQPVVQRYSLAGVLQSTTDVGAITSGWAGAARDGILVMGREASSSTLTQQIDLIGSTGSLLTSYTVDVAVLGALHVDQIPGGPIYLTLRAADGAVQIDRFTNLLHDLDETRTCGTSAFDTTSAARILPGTGSAHAYVCSKGDNSASGVQPNEVTVEYQGSTPWTRTFSDAFGPVGAGHLTGDGRVLLAAEPCVAGRTPRCAEMSLAQIAATGDPTVLLTGLPLAVHHTFPIGADATGWTGFSVQVDQFSIAEVGRRTFSGGSATVPGKPAKPVAVAGPAKVSLSWAAPADGGSPITGYRIVPYKAGVAQTPIDVATITSKEITGLTNGTAYRFTIAARNAIGLGPASDLSDAVTPATVPGPPTGVTAVAGKNTATVAWKPPTSNGGSPITGYKIELIDDGVSLQNITVGNVTSFVVTSLSAGSTYTFRVAAVNAIGTGPSSSTSNPVVMPPAGFTSWAAAADRQFRDLNGRPATTAETSTWVPQLQSGAKTLGTLPAALRTSTDHTSNVDPVTRLYSAYLGRIPDRGGLGYWIGKKRAGTRLTAISSTFAASSEFRRKYGSLTNRAFVELVYQNVLGRPGDAGGITYWTNKLSNGTATRGQVMVGFSESNEYQRSQAERVTAIVLYSFLLGRAPTTAEVDAAVAALEGDGTVAELADEILDSTAYAARIGSL